MNPANEDGGRRSGSTYPQHGADGAGLYEKHDGMRLSSIALNVPGAQRRTAKIAKKTGAREGPGDSSTAQTLLDGRLLNVRLLNIQSYVVKNE